MYSEQPKINAMMESYDYIKLMPAKNGIILEYEEKYKPEGAKELDSCQYRTVKEIFKVEEAAKAVERMMELHNKNKDSDEE